MATLAELNVRIGANIDDFERAMNQVQQGVGRLGDKLKSAGSALTLGITLPLTALGVAAVSAYGKLDSLQRGLNAITTQELAKQGVAGLNLVQEATALTSARVKELYEISKAPGIGFEQAERGDIRLRAVGISAAQSAKSLKEFANAVATSGGSAADLDRVTVQLAQLSAKGKVLAQDLRPIIEAAPSVASALQTLYGTVDSADISAALEKQGKSSSDFISILTDELAKLPRVTGSLTNDLENFQNNAVQDAGRLGESISKAFNLSGVLASVSGAITGMVDAFTGLDPATQKLILFGLAGAAALGPIVFAAGAVLAAIPSVVAGLEVLGLAGTVALGPIGIAAAAIAAAAYLIISNWDALVAYFGAGGPGGQVFGNLADSVVNAVREISAALASLGSNNFGGLISASKVLQDVIQSIAVGFTALADVVGGTIGAITRLLQGDFVGALEQAKRAVFGLVDPLASVFGFIKKNSAALSGSFADALVPIEQVTGLIGGDLSAALGRAAAGLGLLARLEEQLKAAKEALPTLQTEKQITSQNILIDGLEKEIKRLEELGLTRKGQATALEALQKNLLNNANASRALGDLYDYLGGKAGLLESGIKSLTDAGFAPGGRTVQQYVTQLRAIPEAVDQAVSRVTKGLEKFNETPPLKLKLEADYGGSLDVANGRNPLERPTRLGVIDTAPFVASAQVATEQMALFQLTAENFTAGLDRALVNGLSDIAAGFGEGIGNILSGAAGLSDLSGIVLGAIGGLAIQVGQLAIGTGIAVLGIKTALESLNPALAIGAGIALVALGTAVKGSLGSLGGGGGGRGSSLGSTPSSSLSGPAATARQQPLKIEVVVSGQLKGSGKDLVAIIQAQDYRRLRTS